MTTVGNNEICIRDNLVGPFLVHKLLGPPPPPLILPCLSLSLSLTLSLSGSLSLLLSLCLSPSLSPSLCLSLSLSLSQAKVIQQACMKADKPFFDEKFWYGHRHTMYPKGAPADCTVTEPRKAMRVSELYPNAPLFSNGTESNDIVQGAIGDCFFIGALSALACSKRASLKPIQRLFIFADTKYACAIGCPSLSLQPVSMHV